MPTKLGFRLMARARLQAPIALVCGVFAAIACGQTTGDANAIRREVLHSLEAGSFGSLSEQQAADAKAGKLDAVLEERFASSEDQAAKARIAAALTRLGDKNGSYWEYLVARAKVAIESDAPEPRCLGAADKCPGGQTPEFAAWAKAHNVAPGSPQEAAIYGLWQNIADLSSTGDPRAVPLLRQALRSSNFEVAAAAASGLADAQDRDSIPLIVAACKSASSEGARMIAQSLTRFSDPEAQSAAKQFLPKPADPVEGAKKDGPQANYFVEQLARTHATQAIPMLEEKFEKSQNVLDKAHVANALIRLGVKDNLYWDYLVETAMPAIRSDAPNFMLFDAQGKALPGPSPEFVAWAKARNLELNTAGTDAVYHFPARVMLLGSTGDLRASPLLRQALASPNYQIEIAAALGLAEIKDKESIPLIIQACKQAPAEVASEIAKALVYFDDAEAQAAFALYVPKETAQLYRDARAAGKTPFR